ncbi:hypothetical protein JW930_04275 [Candidatus Woesearchaeota archaeon]|nr:hypothetical protein [Candidatus Woesearchaeota archaeon]
MSIVGFNFTKIVVEKKKQAIGKINIANNFSIKEVREAKLNLGKSSQRGLEFNFEFSSKYQDDIGSIELFGFLIFMDKEEKVKEALSSWKKDKKIPKEIIDQVYNHIISRSYVEALLLSREVQLPPPIPLPRIAQRQTTQ